MAASNGVNGSKKFNEGTFLFTVSLPSSFTPNPTPLRFGHILFSLSLLTPLTALV